MEKNEILESVIRLLNQLVEHEQVTLEEKQEATQQEIEQVAKALGID